MGPQSLSATAGSEGTVSPAVRDRLLAALRTVPLDAAGAAALFPELGAARGADPTFASVRRAASTAVPRLRLVPGLLRAPAWSGRPAPLLSLIAAAIDGPASPLDRLSAERLLATSGWETTELAARAVAARRALVAAQVGGDWWHDQRLPDRADSPYVMIEGTPAPPRARAMLEAALARHDAGATVVVAQARGAKWRDPGALLESARRRGCTVIAAPVDPWRIIERAREVYTSGGETGFLALLAGRQVHCFGDAFYTGWGITCDCAGVIQRGVVRGVDEVFAAACLVATRCRDPFRNTAATFEDIVAILAEWRRIEEANRRIRVCLGMAWWKRRRIAEFLGSAAGPPVFRRGLDAALKAAKTRPAGAIAVWASRAPPGLAAAAACQDSPVIWVEDGFLRSVGLGADFAPASSLALDRIGPHYDPGRPSELERLLRETEFAPALIARAETLIRRLVALGVTKYNLVGPRPLPDLPRNRARILVPGQVEDDLSVKLGGAGIAGNRALLARVRALNPDAFLIYKPHPDVEAGHRPGAISDSLALRDADVVAGGMATPALLAAVDEVHTLTSLMGFEALLRGRRVVVHGRPFYAGWGLTTDLPPFDRGRRLSLAELVAGALILYPRYLDPLTRLPCPPEIVIERLGDRTLWRPGLVVAARRWQGRLARLLPAALAPLR